MGLAARVRALRDEFDRSFALPSAERRTAQLHLLSVEVGGTRVAIRLSEVASVRLDPLLTPVPGSPLALLGLTTIGGQAWPVFDLAAALGQERQKRPRVLCLLRGGLRVAFAFEHFLGLSRVPLEAVTSSPPTLDTSEAVLTDDGFFPLLSLTRAADRCTVRPRTGKTNEEGAPT